ncbi:unnamed protein product, partial [Rotaria magnacalcarata]
MMECNEDSSNNEQENKSLMKDKVTEKIPNYEKKINTIVKKDVPNVLVFVLNLVADVIHHADVCAKNADGLKMIDRDELRERIIGCP